MNGRCRVRRSREEDEVEEGMAKGWLYFGDLDSIIIHLSRMYFPFSFLVCFGLFWTFSFFLFLSFPT